MLRFREKSVMHPTSARMATERQYSQARGIAAATMISKIMRNTRAHGHLLKYTGQLCVISCPLSSYDPQLNRTQHQLSLQLSHLFLDRRPIT